MCSSDLMIAIAGRDDLEAITAAARRVQVETWLVGEVRAGTKGVRFAER